MEGPKQKTPEEIAEIEKSRTISDAELLKGGAEYAVDEREEKKNLLITEDQRYNIIKEHENDPEVRVRELFKTLEKTFGQDIKSLDERDSKLREASADMIKLIVKNSEKKLYATVLFGRNKYSEREVADFRLWNQKPQMHIYKRGSGLAGRIEYHPDWGLNYRIGLAQSSGKMTKTEIEELIKDISAKLTDRHSSEGDVLEGDLYEYEINPSSK